LTFDSGSKCLLAFDACRRADGEAAENVFGFQFVKRIGVLRSRDATQTHPSVQPDKHLCCTQSSVPQHAAIDG
jgi:hypothetical protein